MTKKRVVAFKIPILGSIRCPDIPFVSVDTIESADGVLLVLQGQGDIGNLYGVIPGFIVSEKFEIKEGATIMVRPVPFTEQIKYVPLVSKKIKGPLNFYR